jgi:hypothetical protein
MTQQPISNEGIIIGGILAVLFMSAILYAIFIAIGV